MVRILFQKVFSSQFFPEEEYLFLRLNILCYSYSVIDLILPYHWYNNTFIKVFENNECFA